MFQYAAAKHLALTHGTQLTLDLGWFKYEAPTARTPRHYELGVFALDRTVTKRAYLPFGQWSFLPWKHSLRLPVAKEKGIGFSDRLLASPDNVWLHGYWQSEKYFGAVGDQIKQAFRFVTTPDARNASLIEGMEGHNSVSLHVRRGDYLHFDNLGVMSLDYYMAAIEEIATKVLTPSFYVFSDDPQWAKEHIVVDYPTTYVFHNEGRLSFEDMRLMSHCRHHIVGNSSFSWWGAWLGEHEDAVVVAPKDWFADDRLDSNDLVPDRWITR